MKENEIDCINKACAADTLPRRAKEGLQLLSSLEMKNELFGENKYIGKEIRQKRIQRK